MNAHQTEMLFRKAVKGEKSPGSLNAGSGIPFLKVTWSTNGSKLLAKIKHVILKRHIKKAEGDNWGGWN